MVPAGGRQPPPYAIPPIPPPPPATTPLGVASHLPPSGKISYAVLTCWPLPPMHYITGYLHAVHYCLKYAHTIYL